MKYQITHHPLLAIGAGQMSSRFNSNTTGKKTFVWADNRKALHLRVSSAEHRVFP